MPPRNKAASGGDAAPPAGAETGGLYEVKESGIHFRHVPKDLPTPRDGQEFLERLRNKFQINVLERPTPNELVFELIGVDVSFANALRRIMLAEVPTVAIEHVYMWNNSSIVHDEVLAHRLGLVPIDVDPKLFEDFTGDDDDPTEWNTVVFRLGVTCGKTEAEDERKARRKKKTASDGGDGADGTGGGGGAAAAASSAAGDSVLGNAELDAAARDSSALRRATQPESLASAIETPGRPYTKHVYSSDLEWVPQGDQSSRFPRSIRPVHEDVLLAKLRPGQTIELEAHARRGIGKDHAKFSPVATASYRLMPRVRLERRVYDESAEALCHLYEPGVFKLVPAPPPRRVEAVVDNPYACTVSRNYMRDPVLKESVKVDRIPNHFIFQIESVGMMKPGVILAESLKVLQGKCQNLIRLCDESMEGEGL